MLPAEGTLNRREVDLEQRDGGEVTYGHRRMAEGHPALAQGHLETTRVHVASGRV